MKDFFYKIALKYGPYLYMGLSRMLFASCRVTEYGRHHFDACLENPPFIAVSWHYGVVYSIHSIYNVRRFQGQPWVMMLSASRDAEYFAGVLRRMKLEVVRGSKGKSGLAAVKNMVARVKQGCNAGIIVDGSTGPARKVQAGVIFLASKAGVPILPVGWAADRYIAFNSWDRTVLPKPFARIDKWYGEPLAVPKKLSSKSLEEYRLELENRLNDLYDKSWQQFGKKEHF